MTLDQFGASCVDNSGHSLPGDLRQLSQYKDGRLPVLFEILQ